MVFWFFKKRKELEKKVNNLSLAVQNSFNNLKHDMSTISKWIKTLDGEDKKIKSKIVEQESKLIKVESKIDLLISMIQNQKPVAISSKQKELPEPPSPLNIEEIIKNLTPTQQNIFLKLFSHQQNLGYNTVSLKSLATLVYGDKEYNDVRSTLSEYLAILAEWGLVTKKRKGKESFVSITSLGFNIIKKLSTNQKTKKITKEILKR